jgi:hypothetical protein
MKTILIFLSFSFIFTSCVSIYFTETQPKGGTMLNEIPNELIGNWMESENNYIGFDKKGKTGTKYVSDSLGNIVDTIFENIPLSDSLRIFQVKNIYILNYKEKGKNWGIITFKPQLNGDIFTYQIDDPHFFAKDRNLKLVKAVYIIDGEEKVVNTLNPNYENNLQFQSATFSGQMKIKTLKKMMSENRIMNILKKDGSIYVPSE